MIRLRISVGTASRFIQSVSNNKFVIFQYFGWFLNYFQVEPQSSWKRIEKKVCVDTIRPGFWRWHRIQINSMRFTIIKSAFSNHRGYISMGLIENNPVHLAQGGMGRPEKSCSLPMDGRPDPGPAPQTSPKSAEERRPIKADWFRSRSINDGGYIKWW